MKHELKFNHDADNLAQSFFVNQELLMLKMATVVAECIDSGVIQKHSEFTEVALNHLELKDLVLLASREMARMVEYLDNANDEMDKLLKSINDNEN